MRKKLLLLIIFIICFITTGCSVKYEIYIKDDLSVVEAVTGTESKSKIYTSLHYENMGEFVNGLVESSGYKDLGAEVKTEGSTDDYSGYVKTTYKTIEDYVKTSPAITELFDEIVVNETSNNINFKSKGFYPLNEITSSRTVIDDLEIKVISHYGITGLKNASCKIKDGYNVCTFNINKNAENYSLDFNINKSFNLTTFIVILGIGGIILLVLIGLYVYGRFNKSKEI